jgi:hypothetical protein
MQYVWRNMKFIQNFGRKTSVNRPFGRLRVRMGPCAKVLKYSSSIRAAFLDPRRGGPHIYLFT